MQPSLLKLIPILLPIEEASKLCITENGTLTFIESMIIRGGEGYTPNYLYLCSTREIKRGDWCYDSLTHSVGKQLKKLDKKYENRIFKIEFTSDISLIKDKIAILPESVWVEFPFPFRASQRINFLEEFIKRYNQQPSGNVKGVNKLINKYTEKIIIDYPEKDKLHIDLMSFLNEANQTLQSNADYSLQDTFGSFIRTHQLSKKWEDFISIKPVFPSQQSSAIKLFCEMEDYEYSDRASDSISYDNINYNTRIKIVNDQPIIHFKY